MKPKPKKNQSPNNGQRVTIGRTKVALPTRGAQTPAQQARSGAARSVARIDAQNEVVARLRAENAQLKREKKESNLESIALLRCQAEGLSKSEAHRLANKIVNQSRRHEKAQEAKEPNLRQHFDPYKVATDWISKHKQGAVSPTGGGAPTTELPARNADGSLPSPTPRQARTFQEIVEARKRYEQRLRELGLSDPSLGYPGGNPGGLGY